MPNILAVDFQAPYPEKRYEGRREGHAAIVTVNDRPLHPRLEVHNHSPTGFEWGYGGSGPAQLALALLADHFGDPHRALALYQEFKRMVVANLAYERWTLTAADIDAAVVTISRANSSAPVTRRTP